MKKLFALTVAVLLSLSLAVPALAFTGDTADDVDHPYDLKIYLVEYDDNDLFGLASLPPSDRGYAKNEIVAAVVELIVPEDEEILFGEYGTLVFGGENVDLDVADNYNNADDIDLATTDNIGDLAVGAYILEPYLIDDEILIGIGEYDGFIGEETYKWLFFAKVTGDDASLYAKLTDGSKYDEFEEDKDREVLEITLSGVEYNIYFEVDADELSYQIEWDDDDGIYSFVILTDEDYKSTGMLVYIENDDYDRYFSLGVNTKGELGVVDPDNPAKILTSGDLYDDVMDIYKDVVVDVFGLDYFNIGNYVRKSFFENLVSPDTIISTVNIAPFTAYVTVPDNIVVDPPKTGDAASIMGFVMVALSFAGTALLKKRS